MSRLMHLMLDPQQLHTRYQPIVDCQDLLTPIAILECLIRGPQGTNLSNPQVLFEYARRKHCEHTLDLLIFRRFLQELSGFREVPFSINFHFSTLSHDPEVVEQIIATLEEFRIGACRLHIELIESVPEINMGLLLQNLKGLRKAGVQLVLDDFGMAHANLHLLSVVQPEIVKIDRTLLPVAGSDRKAPYFEAALRSASAVGAKIVAEGIETQQQFEYVRSLGVTFAQGYYFYKPLEFYQLQEQIRGPGLEGAWRRKLPKETLQP